MLDCFQEERGLSSSSYSIYKMAINSYVNYCSLVLKQNDISFKYLVALAEEEEQKQILWKNRRVKKLLVGFRQWLFKNKSFNTAVTYFSKIKTLYRHFDIEIQDLPVFKSKQFSVPCKSFSDIPTVDDIRCALRVCSNMEVRAIILLAATSGLSRVDILNLSVNDFFKACDCRDELTVGESLKKIKSKRNEEDFILCFRGRRQKTGSPFMTFATREVAGMIIECLEERLISKEDKLFVLSNNQLGYQLKKVNDLCGFGRVDFARKFRLHQLRAFHASMLVNNGFSVEEVDFLQGRVKDRTHRAYFFEDPVLLKEKYLGVFGSVFL